VAGRDTRVRGWFKWIVSSPATIAGSVLVTAGILFLGYSIGAYYELVPGSRVSVPPPVALSQPRPTATLAPPTPTLAAPTATPIPQQAAERPQQIVMPRPTLRPITGAMLAPPDPSVYADPMLAADADDRAFMGNRPHPGTPLKLQIPSIDVDTEVNEGGIIINDHGEAEWETVPFVALHYRETAPVGGRGNAVISGHVVTISWGNVFRDLYKLNFGDTVQVETDEGRFTYIVEDLKLVKPSNVEVMGPSTSSMLTLITCGGDFDTRTRSFDSRLIVTSRLVDWERLPAS
jgi:LPXTG-site transpeptidase (sortase) family protein